MGSPSREGEVIDGKYRILHKLGEGGMGAVYAGEHLRLKRTVAIKMLHGAASAQQDMAERFEREAQAAGQIGSDHIVEVYDIGQTPAGERFMVLEYLDGESLRTRLKRERRLSVGRAAALTMQVLTGLGAAHVAGIIHRDLKPDNVFILKEKAGRAQFVKILDFGISKFTQLGESGSTTRTGTVMGSPNYMSPEHVQAANRVDARSDLYSIGIMLFEMVTGTIPRKGSTFAELLFKVVYEPVPDPRTLVPDLDPAFAALILRACSQKPEERFASAAEFAAALAPFSGILDESTADGASTFALTPAVPSGDLRTQVLAGAGSHPSFNQSPQPGSQSQPSGAGSHPSFGSGTGPFAPAGAGSQPNFGAGSQPNFGAGSQPSFGAGSQPSFGAGSQPNLGAGSQPSLGAGSQPSLGAGSQPNFGAGSQPSYAAQFSVTQGKPAGRTSGAVIIGVGAAIGIAIGAFLFFRAAAPGEPVANAAPAESKPSAAAAAAATAQPSVAATASAEVSASAEASAPAPTTKPAAQRPPAAKPPPGKPGPAPKPGGGVEAGY